MPGQPPHDSVLTQIISRAPRNSSIYVTEDIYCQVTDQPSQCLNRHWTGQQLNLSLALCASDVNPSIAAHGLTQLVLFDLPKEAAELVLAVQRFHPFPNLITKYNS